MRDLADRADLDVLLAGFYDAVLSDAQLRPVFVDVMHIDLDLDAHLHRLADFWEKVLFNTGAYHGTAVQTHRAVHRRTPLRAELFERWLDLWHAALDARFAGPVTEQARRHADRMAGGFQRALEQPRHPRELALLPAAVS